MQIINVEEFEESFVIHFGTEAKKINAYTLASTLVAFADVAKAANSILNPGYEVEVVVEALGSGSFRARIKTFYKGLNNLWSNQNLRAIVLSILASYIYQNTIAPNQEVKVTVDDSQVQIVQGNKTIIIPRHIHDALKEVEKSEKFSQEIQKTFDAVEKDPEIKSFGITKNLDDPEPTFVVEREKFPKLEFTIPEEPENSRIVVEVVELQILKAILERSKRRWEFVWRGIKISAPVLDENFYQKFFKRVITLAPGDSLQVKMKIYQKRDSGTGIYTNERYEIMEVQEHIPSPKQKYLI